MSIQELSLKFKGYLNNTDILLSILIIVVSLTSFFLGRFSITENTHKIQQKAEFVSTVNQAITQKEGSVETTNKTPDVPQSAQSEGGYVASKSGTKYHLPWCSGAKRIKEENKVWFATKEEAEAAGYSPASNCKGL